ncbi:MAG: hypothetical protein WBA13_20400 [Microcoleaceae cyanobacterium]
MNPLEFVGRVILTRLFQLLVCITTEAWILKRGLAISPKASVKYAAAINLLANSVSWLIFFTLEPIVPNFLKQQLLSNLTSSINNLSLFFMGFSILNFLIFLVIKWQALYLVRVLTDKEPVMKVASTQQGYQFRIIVKAHTISHILTLLIFLLGKLEQI